MTSGGEMSPARMRSGVLRGSEVAETDCRGDLRSDFTTSLTPRLRDLVLAAIFFYRALVRSISFDIVSHFLISHIVASFMSKDKLFFCCFLLSNWDKIKSEI